MILEVAVWGLGPHAKKNLLPALNATAGVHLRGVCSRDPDVVAEVSRQYGCEAWTDPDQMLSAAGLDAVCVATPIGLHAEHSTRVLAANLHLWCEKPLAHDLEHTERLIEFSRQQGRAVGEGFMYLHHPQFRDVRAALSSGALGSIASVTCRFGIPALERPGFRTNPDFGGGAFLDVGTYPISAAVGLVPDDAPTISFARIGRQTGSTVDTEGNALLQYGSGASVLLEWRINVAYRSELEIWGTCGSLLTERVFSKPSDYVPLLRFRDAYGRERVEPGEAANHFALMFAVWRATVQDAQGAEAERRSICQRAGLADRIRRKAHEWREAE